MRETSAKHSRWEVGSCWRLVDWIGERGAGSDEMGSAPFEISDPVGLHENIVSMHVHSGRIIPGTATRRVTDGRRVWRELNVLSAGSKV
jgi:hypothetical protein